MTECIHPEAWLIDECGRKTPRPATEANPLIVGRESENGPHEPDAWVIGKCDDRHFRTISRRHALIYYDPAGGWEIEKAETTQALMIDGLAVESGRRAPLRNGTQIQLGLFRVTFETARAVPPEADAPAPPPQEVSRPSVTPGTGNSETEEGKTEFRPELIPKPAPAPPPPAPGGRVLLRAEAAGGGEFELPFYPVRRSWTVGRCKHPPIEVTGVPLQFVALPDEPRFKAVSREHAWITVNERGEWSLENRGRSWTQLDGVILRGSGSGPLRNGSQVVLGGAAFTFLIEGEAAAPRPREEDKEERQATVLAPPWRNERAVGEEMLDAWGCLVECREVNGLRFPLRERVIRIGSHPINCQVRLEGPGINDVFAVLEWCGQESLRIASKNSDLMVQVNHGQVRAGTVKAGDTISLGNREFQLEVFGPAPVPELSAVRRKILRLLAAAAGGVALLLAVIFLLVKWLQPAPPAPLPVTPAPGLTAAQLVEQYGFSALGELKKTSTEGSNQSRQRLAQALTLLAAVDRLTRDTPNEEQFLLRQGEIDLDWRQALKILASDVRPDIEQRPPAWLEPIPRNLAQRREAARAGVWKQILALLAKNDFKTAQERLTLADSILPGGAALKSSLKAYEEVAAQVGAVNVGALVTGYTSLRQDTPKAAGLIERTRRDVAACRATLAGLDAQLGAHPGLTEALQAQRRQLAGRLDTVGGAADALKAYREGDTAGFFGALGKLDKKQTPAPLGEEIRSHVQAWADWLAKYEKNAGAGREALVLLRSRYETIADQGAPVLQRMRDLMEVKAAVKPETPAPDVSRAWAAALTEPDELNKISRMVAVYKQNPQADYRDKIDDFAPQVFSRLQRDALDEAARGRLRGLLDDYRRADPEENLISHRQLKALLGLAD